MKFLFTIYLFVVMNMVYAISEIPGQYISEETVENIVNDFEYMNGTNNITIGDFDYGKLKELDLIGQLDQLSPVEMNYSQVMIAISEFTVYKHKNIPVITVGLDYLSNQEINIYNASGELFSTIIIRNIDQVSIDVDISKFPPGSYVAADGQTLVEFIID